MELSWAVLGRLGALLGRLDAVLGASLAVLGHLGPSLCQLGSLGSRPGGHLGRLEAEKSARETSWSPPGRLGSLLGTSGAISLGHLDALLGRCTAVLGTLWDLLGDLGVFLVRLRAPLRVS